MHRSKIEWCQNPDGSLGWVWNPLTGCLNNCSYCYAEKLANTRLKERYLANDNIAPVSYPLPDIPASLQPFYPRLWTEKLDQPFALKKPAGIFTCSMSDLFGIGIPDEWTKSVMTIIDFAYQHRFYLLTKQPQNLIKFSPFPDNCWVGVSATDERMALDAIIQLADNQVKLRYLSIEPMLARIHLPPKYLRDCGIKWVIIGALTGTKADLLPLHHKTGLIMVRLNGNRWSLQPQTEWVREIVSACDKAGIPVFLKDNLEPLLRQNDHNVYSYPEWAGKQFAITSDHSLAPTNPYPNEPMRKLRQERPK